jgi:hypothetical protein
MTLEVGALVPERSVPVSGFSRELRNADDVERFRFDFPLQGEALWPVHIVFSLSQKTAEVKSGDLKALRLAGVDSVEDARNRWIAWWRSRSGKPRVLPPRRTGRLPAASFARP